MEEFKRPGVLFMRDDRIEQEMDRCLRASGVASVGHSEERAVRQSSECTGLSKFQPSPVVIKRKLLVLICRADLDKTPLNV